MDLTLKPGTRIYSSTDSTELIAIKVPTEPIDLTIGGHPAVLSADDRTEGMPIPGHDDGVAIGKRYVDSDNTVELLVTKAGASTPAIAGQQLVWKETKPLRASD